MKTEILKTATWLVVCAMLGITIITLLKVNWLENDLREIDRDLNTGITNRLIELKFMIMEEQEQIHLYNNSFKEFPLPPLIITQTVELGTMYTLIEGCKIVYFTENGKVVYCATPEELGMR